MRARLLPFALSLALLSACTEPRVGVPVVAPPKFQLGPNNPAAPLVVTPDGDVVEAGSLTVSIKGLLGELAKHRRVLATVADVDHVVVTVLAGTQEFSQTISKAAISAGQLTASFSGIPAGSVTVKMAAYGASNQLLGSASESATVTAGATTNVNITLQLAPTYQPPAGSGGSTATTGGVSVGGTLIDGPVFAGADAGAVLETIQLEYPAQALAVDHDGNALLGTGSTSASIRRYAAGGAYVSWPLSFSNQDPMTMVPFLQVDANGDVWVADFYSYELQRYGTTPDWTKKAHIGAMGNVMTLHVVAAVGNDGNAWFWDGSTISKYGPDGSKLATANQNAYPLGAATVDRQGNLWLGGIIYPDMAAGIAKYQLAKVSPTGAHLSDSFVGTLDAASYGGSIYAWPACLISDTDQNIWMAMPTMNQVVKVSPNLDVLARATVGTKPVDLALDPYGNVWVANLDSNNITKLSPSGQVLATYPLTAPTRLKIGKAGVWVLHEDGQKLSRLAF